IVSRGPLRCALVGEKSEPASPTFPGRGIDRGGAAPSAAMAPKALFQVTCAELGRDGPAQAHADPVGGEHAGHAADVALHRLRRRLGRRRLLGLRRQLRGLPGICEGGEEQGGEGERLGSAHADSLRTHKRVMRRRTPAGYEAPDPGLQRELATQVAFPQECIDGGRGERPIGMDTTPAVVEHPSGRAGLVIAGAALVAAGILLATAERQAILAAIAGAGGLALLRRAVAERPYSQALVVV